MWVKSWICQRGYMRLCIEPMLQSRHICFTCLYAGPFLDWNWFKSSSILFKFYRIYLGQVLNVMIMLVILIAIYSWSTDYNKGQAETAIIKWTSAKALTSYYTICFPPLQFTKSCIMPRPIDSGPWFVEIINYHPLMHLI